MLPFFICPFFDQDYEKDYWYQSCDKDGRTSTTTNTTIPFALLNRVGQVRSMTCVCFVVWGTHLQEELRDDCQCYREIAPHTQHSRMSGSRTLAQHH